MPYIGVKPLTCLLLSALSNDSWLLVCLPTGRTVDFQFSEVSIQLYFNSND